MTEGEKQSPAFLFTSDFLSKKPLTLDQNLEAVVVASINFAESMSERYRACLKEPDGTQLATELTDLWIKDLGHSWLLRDFGRAMLQQNVWLAESFRTWWLSAPPIQEVPPGPKQWHRAARDAAIAECIAALVRDYPPLKATRNKAKRTDSPESACSLVREILEKNLNINLSEDAVEEIWRRRGGPLGLADWKAKLRGLINGGPLASSTIDDLIGDDGFQNYLAFIRSLPDPRQAILTADIDEGRKKKLLEIFDEMARLRGELLGQRVQLDNNKGELARLRAEMDNNKARYQAEEAEHNEAIRRINDEIALLKGVEAAYRTGILSAAEAEAKAKVTVAQAEAEAKLREAKAQARAEAETKLAKAEAEREAILRPVLNRLADSKAQAQAQQAILEQLQREFATETRRLVDLVLKITPASSSMTPSGDADR
jgi:hypothetical protein